MRIRALLFAALALLAAAAQAAKPDERQIKSLADQADLSCRDVVAQLPGLASNYHAPSICGCAHGATVAQLRRLELDNPAEPTKADRDKIAGAEQHAVLVCAQPAYTTALAKSTETDCRARIGDVPSAHDLNDTQKLGLCNCIGMTVAQAVPLTKIAELGKDKTQAFADNVLQQAYSACKAAQTAHQ
jgi:hypothetical protein